MAVLRKRPRDVRVVVGAFNWTLFAGGGGRLGLVPHVVNIQNVPCGGKIDPSEND